MTDQVEVQGEKIRDLDTSLEHHREKLNATEELLQQVRPPHSDRPEEVKLDAIVLVFQLYQVCISPHRSW